MPRGDHLGGIWAGFDNIFYFFSHEDSRGALAIPHDLRNLNEVFGLETDGYRRQSAFWIARAIPDLLPPAGFDGRTEAEARIAETKHEYARLSDRYQGGKAANDIPLA